MDFSFESVARGEDTMFNYGAASWGFGLRAGHVVNERFTVANGATATFDEALERHRDFYVHEPVTFYFDFDSATLNAPEAAKISSFLPYLRRNPGVTLSLEGFADMVGGRSAYNRDLSTRRVESVESALLAAGVPAGALSSISYGRGASTAATPDAGTGDQLGSAAVGADQSREANRWANRRVVLTFTAPVAAPTPAPAPGNTP
jgi:outer membrane protein OmpA-like peptidoglycan-associated protein